MADQSNPQPTPRGWTPLFAAWFVATSATLTSLFLSEIVGVPVCNLCWYQRIALYPLVVILATGLFPYEPRMLRPASWLIAIGWLIALFHLLLVAGIIPEALQPCVQGIPCSKTYFTLFGLLDIPTMSLLTFSLLGLLLYLTHWMDRHEP